MKLYFLFLTLLFSLMLTACGGSSGGAAGSGGTSGGGSRIQETTVANDYFTSAQSIQTNNLVEGSLEDSEDETDYYTFTLNSEQSLRATLTSNKDFALILYDSGYNTLAYQFTSNNSEIISRTLDAGTYYLAVAQVIGSGDYTLEFN